MTEAQATADLAIKHYPRKWQSAQKHAAFAKGRPEYWETVRRYYLELGGIYIHQLNPKQRTVYFEGATKA